MLCPDDIIVPELFKEKLNNTNQLYLELDLSDPNLQGQMMQTAMMRGDTTLSHFFSVADYEKLAGDFQDFTGMPLQFMAQMKPYLLTSVLMMSAMKCQVQGWEHTLMELTRADSIPVKGLETVVDQMAIFDIIPYSLQAESLKKSLANTDSLVQVIQQMVTIYKSQDIEQMYQLINEDQTLAAYNSILLGDRNRRWIPIIVEQAIKTPTFFAVGAGHLGGEQGVINLLRNIGYRVTPIGQ